LAVLKCVKIREFYEFFKIRKMRILGLCLYLFVDRPTGQTAQRIFTRDDSDNAASRKGQTFSGTEIRS